jgi:thiol-disulfide isomerase/thioredoxin
MSSISLGVFAIQTSQLLLLCCFLVAICVAQVVAWRRKLRVFDTSLQIILAGVLAARLVFVLRWFPQYATAPLAMLDIRDGGFDIVAGIVAGAAFAIWRAWRRAELRTPIAAGVFAFLLAWIYVNPSMHALPENLSLPASEVTTFSGQTTHLQQMGQGKPMVLNLWASWCPPCRREMPMLVRTAAQRHDLAFVFINEDSNLADALQFMKEAGVPQETVVADANGTLMKQLRAAALPTTLFVAADGKVVSIHVGGLSEATLQNELQKLRR